MTRGRRPRPPDVAALLPRGDRVLASAPLVDGGWAVASTASLTLVRDGAIRWSRDWPEVDHGTWAAEDETVSVRWVDARPETTLRLVPDSGRSFAVVFRERVQASVVHVEQSTLPSGATARCAIRRDARGGIFSQIIVDGASVLTTADRSAVDALERSAREAVGLPA